MTSENIARAARSRLLVGDGAMGTQLIERGLEAGECPELWNIERRSDVLEIQRSYREAGADLLITNTFGGTRWKLDGFHLGDRVGEISSAAVEIAREAGGEDCFVLGDIGPTGRFVAPLGTDPREAFVEVFAEQAGALVAAGADAVILETFTALDELLAALEAARATNLPVVASMSYERRREGVFHTMMGADLPGSTQALVEAGADVICGNCGTGPSDYVEIARDLCAATDLPVMIEPNAGAPRLEGGRQVFPMGPEEMAGYAGDLLAAGVRILGGCCGTGPEHIREIRKAVDRLA